MTPLYLLEENENKIFIMRDDLLPYCFGGNKARKARLFFEEIDKGGYTCVVTYGSFSSNHCRVVANMAAGRGLKCHIISALETQKDTFNSKMLRLFGASVTAVDAALVADTIDKTLERLRAQGERPYFIAGGGHGNLGTQAYVDAYGEILQYERESGIFFDRIFHASGTGTTQAGLICGALLNGDRRDIAGISIARKNPRGGEVVADSVFDYMRTRRADFSAEAAKSAVNFIDKYIGEGYGKSDVRVKACAEELLVKHGIPTDLTYTAKAYRGMLDYIEENEIKGENILFIHTGGSPLFFDDLEAF